jgi:hypothetical protein
MSNNYIDSRSMHQKVGKSHVIVNQNVQNNNHNHNHNNNQNINHINNNVRNNTHNLGNIQEIKERKVITIPDTNRFNYNIPIVQPGNKSRYSERIKQNMDSIRYHQNHQNMRVNTKNNNNNKLKNSLVDLEEDLLKIALAESKYLADNEEKMKNNKNISIVNTNENSKRISTKGDSLPPGFVIESSNQSNMDIDTETETDTNNNTNNKDINNEKISYINNVSGLQSFITNSLNTSTNMDIDTEMNDATRTIEIIETKDNLDIKHSETNDLETKHSVKVTNTNNNTNININIRHIDFIIGRGHNNPNKYMNIPINPELLNRNIIYIDPNPEMNADIKQLMHQVDYSVFDIKKNSIKTRFMFDWSSFYCGGLQHLEEVAKQIDYEFEVLVPLEKNENNISSTIESTLNKNKRFNAAIVNGKYPLFDWSNTNLSEYMKTSQNIKSLSDLINPEKYIVIKFI